MTKFAKKEDTKAQKSTQIYRKLCNFAASLTKIQSITIFQTKKL